MNIRIHGVNVQNPQPHSGKPLQLLKENLEKSVVFPSPDTTGTPNQLTINKIDKLIYYQKYIEKMRLETERTVKTSNTNYI